MYKFGFCLLFIYIINANAELKQGSKGATLKPLSVCCEIPELGEAKHLATCSNSTNRSKMPCSEVECIFQESGFLIDKTTLNKDAFKNHLNKWADDNKGWSVAVQKVITDCVDTDPREHLGYPCKSYDVFACAGIAFLKRCPKESWKC